MKADYDRFVAHVARVLFVQAWADWKEQYGGGHPPGCELMTAAPATPKEAVWAAEHFVEKLEAAVASIPTIIERASPTWAGHGDFIEELAFGLVMPALGHGVSWLDDNDAFEGYEKLPMFEFSCFDLDENDYPIPEEAP